MKTEDEKKVVPSFNELVFENRNKEYGAYQIRKKYDSALFWSIFVSVFFISATVITPFIVYEGMPIEVVPIDDDKAFELDSTIIIDRPEPEPPKPMVEKAPKLDYSRPVIVDSLSNEEAKKFLSNDVRNANITNDSVPDYTPEPERPEIEPEDNTINESFSVTEKPYFGIGGDNEFRSWIAQNIVYPQSAIDALIQGKVYMQFVVEKDGSISNIQVIRSIDPDLSKEAVKVLEQSPKWNPGKINGSPVRVKISFPITFSINNN
ncbi:MAG: energy transducer TonB [Bacteroidales bacterium]|nr:MAG: energy transducer TonB [Bacteroidales bacterium]